MANEPIFTNNPIIQRGIIQENEVLDKLFQALFKVVNHIPESAEREARDGAGRARKLIANASVKAAAISGSLALPAGPLGWLTLVPDLTAIWRLQAQLVADVGAVFGKQAKLTEESMMYCLFKHAAAQMMRDMVTRMGERVVVQRMSARMTQELLEGIGIKVAQRVARGGALRLLPLLGALGVAVYAYYDTETVGKTAIEFFSKDIEFK
ncbi:MAG TPA: hypothetical protein VIB79_10270 [Candidatus Binatia bacterium]|jgi:hypothetical protein